MSLTNELTIMKSLLASLALISLTVAPAHASPRVDIIAGLVTGLCMYQEGYYATPEQAAKASVNHLNSLGYPRYQISNIMNRERETIVGMTSNCGKWVKQAHRTVRKKSSGHMYIKTHR